MKRSVVLLLSLGLSACQQQAAAPSPIQHGPVEQTTQAQHASAQPAASAMAAVCASRGCPLTIQVSGVPSAKINVVNPSLSTPTVFAGAVRERQAVNLPTAGRYVVGVEPREGFASTPPQVLSWPRPTAALHFRYSQPCEAGQCVLHLQSLQGPEQAGKLSAAPLTLLDESGQQVLFSGLVKPGQEIRLPRSGTTYQVRLGYIGAFEPETAQFWVGVYLDSPQQLRKVLHLRYHRRS